MENNEILVFRGNARDISISLKNKIINRDKKCVICEFSIYVLLEIHHIIPVHAGGSNDESNLICLCPNCHAATHKLNENKASHIIGHYVAKLADHYSIEQILKLKGICNL